MMGVRRSAGPRGEQERLGKHLGVPMTLSTMSSPEELFRG